MRPSVLKYSMAILMLTFCSISVIGQPYTKEKTIERSFKIEKETEVEIANKYGDITVETWDRDSVKVVIVCKVSSSKEAKLEKTFGAINFDFKANKHFIVVSTEIEGSGTFWSDVSEIAGTLFSGGTHTSIDYKLYLPAEQKLNINLKYGDIYMASHKGELNVNLSNGNLKVHSLEGNSKVKLVFADAAINEVFDAEFELNYSTLSTENIEYADIVSQSSELEITTANELKLDSKRDRFTIESAGTLSGELYFTRFNMDKISSKLNLNTKYGNFRLREIGKNVDVVSVKAVNTDVDIRLSKDQNYTINITSDQKSDVTYSVDLGEFETEIISEKDKIMKAKCSYGDMSKAISLDLEIYSGVLSLKMEK